MTAIGLALVAVLGGGYLSPLTLHLSAAPSSINVGEPVRLRVRWSVSEPLHVGSTVDILLARGRAETFVPWLETSKQISFESEGSRLLILGASRTTNHAVSVTGRRPTNGRGNFQFAFPEPGLYRVKVRHRRGPGDAVTSNEVEITAKAPEGADHELFERYLRHDPQLLTPWLRLENPHLVTSLLDRYPRSRYLARPRVIWYERLLEEAIFAAPDPQDLRDPIEGEVPELLQRLADDSLGDSPFEEDRLALLAEMAERTNWPETAARAWRELATRFPESPGGEEARKRLRLASVR